MTDKDTKDTKDTEDTIDRGNKKTGRETERH